MIFHFLLLCREARQTAEDIAAEESRIELLIKRQEKREQIEATAVKMVQIELVRMHDFDQ